MMLSETFKKAALRFSIPITTLVLGLYANIHPVAVTLTSFLLAIAAYPQKTPREKEIFASIDSRTSSPPSNS